MKLKCPLCMNVCFTSEETLLDSLLSFAMIQIACPLCMEVLHGIDKFTIHLYSHIFKFKSNGSVNLVHDPSTNVVSLNEKLENIHLDTTAESLEPKPQRNNSINDKNSNFFSKFNNISENCIPGPCIFNSQTEMTSNEVSIANFSSPTISAYSNNFSRFEVEPRGANESENQQLEEISQFNTNAHARSPMAPKLTRVDESSDSENPCLTGTRVSYPQMVPKPHESTLALQSSFDSNIAIESSTSAIGELSQTAALPVVDNVLKDFDFLFDINESTTDFTKPMKGPSICPERSQTEIFDTMFRPNDLNVEDNEDHYPDGEAVNIHLEGCSGSPRQNILCDICSISFPDVNILTLHKELVHESNVESRFPKPKFHCEHCKRKFKLKTGLLVHQQVAHSIENGIVSIEANQNGENIQFHCTMCPKIFKKENYLIQHMKTHEDKQYACDECGKIFATKHFLQNHKRLHTGEMPYTCSICNKQFTFQQSYHRHIAYHNSEKPHRCKECGKSFKELSTLYNHQRIHTGEKPFPCSVCGKSFRQRVTCLIHSRIHTNTKEFKCSKCQKSFRYKISLRSHKCVHSSNINLIDGISPQL